MTQCTHDFTEREIAVTADGYCPLCQAAEIAKLRAGLEDAQRDLGYIAARCGKGTNRRKVAEAACERARAIISGDEQKLPEKADG